MKKIGILYICTGKYSVLWPGFFESAEKKLLTNCEKHYFVFTDAPTVEHEAECDRIHRIEQEAMEWPYSTLLRFHIFLKCEEQLSSFDYLYFFNADVEIVKEITEEMFLPRIEHNEELVVVQHAGYYNKHPYQFTYDRNPRSKAFIPFGKGTVYVCGGINGGQTSAFLDMCNILSNHIDADLQNGIIALWHDESHLNKYILSHRNYRLLSPSYCHPTQEWWIVPFEAIIEIRDKTKYFDVGHVKAKGNQSTYPFYARYYVAICTPVAAFLWRVKHKASRIKKAYFEL